MTRKSKTKTSSLNSEALNWRCQHISFDVSNYLLSDYRVESIFHFSPLTKRMKKPNYFVLSPILVTLWKIEGKKFIFAS